MITAATIIERALVKARVFSPGESIPSGIMSQCLIELNDLLEMWSIEDYMVVADVRENFPLTEGKDNYTFGDGGDFDFERPIRLKDETYVMNDGIRYNVPYLHPSIYREQSDASTNGIPSLITYEPEFPLGVILLWPPPISGVTLYTKCVKKISSFSDYTTEYDLPPGYSKMIVSNLAVELCSNFGKDVSKELGYSASSSLIAVKRRNRPKNTKMLTTPDFFGLMGGTSSGNINNGPWG